MLAAAASGPTWESLGDDVDVEGGGDGSSHLLWAHVCQAVFTGFPKSGFPHFGRSRPNFVGFGQFTV